MAPHSCLEANLLANTICSKDDETLNAIHWTHWGHCLEIIRQELHCRPSMHLNSMVWQEGQEVFYPDFHTQKRCVRWDDLEEMLSRRIIPFEVSRACCSPSEDGVDASACRTCCMQQSTT